MKINFGFFYYMGICDMGYGYSRGEWEINDTHGATW